MHKLEFNQHEMFTIWILFSTLTTKACIGMCEGASKQSADLKNYTAQARPPPPVLKFLDPPLIIAKIKRILNEIKTLSKHSCK